MGSHFRPVKADDLNLIFHWKTHTKKKSLQMVSVVETKVVLQMKILQVIHCAQQTLKKRDHN